MSHPPISAGTAEFRRINRAMVFGGFSTFALLYCVQPLMPLLARDFALTPAQSSLALSAATGALAVSLLGSSVLSERYGRKPLMAGSMFAGGILTLLAAFAHSYGQLLVLRALLGLLLGGMPALAMAYLSEEIDGPSLGHSMGLYIGGSAFGGMAGRVMSSFISDFYDWRVAVGAMGVAGLYAAWEFKRSLPPSRRFRQGQGGLRALVGGTIKHMGDAGLPWLFCLSFLLMGCFVSMYNYIGYRLLAPPYGLRQSAVGAMSVLYLLGIFSSVWAGKLADRLGRRNVLWIVMAGDAGRPAADAGRAAGAGGGRHGLVHLRLLRLALGGQQLGRAARAAAAGAGLGAVPVLLLSRIERGRLAGRGAVGARRLGRRGEPAGRDPGRGAGHCAAPARPGAAGSRASHCAISRQIR
jgi:YNFM family putative membrane transporter